jgi:hypothetical protein
MVFSFSLLDIKLQMNKMQITLSLLERTFNQYSSDPDTVDAIEAKLRYAISHNRKKCRKSRLSNGIELSPKGKGGKPEGKHRKLYDVLKDIIMKSNHPPGNDERNQGDGQHGNGGQGDAEDDDDGGQGDAEDGDGGQGGANRGRIVAGLRRPSRRTHRTRYRS